MNPRILLVDENLLVAEALRALLEKAAYDVVGVAGDALEAVERAKQVAPDIVLTEILFRESNGLEATRTLKAAVPGAKVILVTACDSRLYAELAVQAGAWGYVLKRSAPTELFEAIRSVLAGSRYITPLPGPTLPR
jgi:DNA-binding NarL/FixJ family response regulator